MKIQVINVKKKRLAASRYFLSPKSGKAPEPDA